MKKTGWLQDSDVSYSLGEYGESTEQLTQQLIDLGAIERLWRKDPTLWIADKEEAKRAPELSNRLGWLHLADEVSADIQELQTFASQIQSQGFETIVLLGSMGGSSLAAEVIAKLFGHKKEWPELKVLDSTSPHSVAHLQASIDLKKTLFLVASKSGGTLETMALFEHFYALYDNPSDHFVTLTDPGSKLEALSKKRQLRRIFTTNPEVGGRFSALSLFGLLPAALIGVSLQEFMGRAAKMVQRCRKEHEFGNPGLVLGGIIAAQAKAGRNKLTFFATPTLSSFSVWAEQLIAESTGKKGFGVVPIAHDSFDPAATLAGDRFFILLKLSGDDASELDGLEQRLKKEKQPYLVISFASKADLAGEFFRFEFATAIIGAVLAINPFDQPDVELSKIKTKQLMQGNEQFALELEGNFPNGDCLYSGVNIATDSARVEDYISQFRQVKTDKSYVAIMAFLPACDQNSLALEKFRDDLREKWQLPVTIGFGPRFLHSTGQLHKGDDGSGLFIQIVQEYDDALLADKIAANNFSFAQLIGAQADGDLLALAEKGRAVLRIGLRGSLENSFASIRKTFADID
jgi:glucose-6-phosphate isomerase